MSDSIVLSGRRHQWELKEFLGKGYSGEVFHVSDPRRPNIDGVLKRPDISNKVNPLIEQAKQIEQEQNILDILSPKIITRNDFSVKVCKVLDRSKKGVEDPRNFFAVTAKASGESILEIAERYRSHNIPFPRLTLLRVLYGLYLQLDLAHSSNITWNDVKPEHLFWDSENHLLTVIDWANGEFVEANGITKNLNFSIEGDYFLFVEGLANFVNENDPVLSALLGWPDSKSWRREITSVNTLIEKIQVHLQSETNKLNNILDNVAQIIKQPARSFEQLQNLISLQDQFIFYGEKSNFSKVESFAKKLSLYLIQEKGFEEGFEEEFEKSVSAIMHLPEIEQGKWLLLRDINRVVASEKENFTESIRAAILTHALEDEWELALWGVFKVKIKFADSEPSWWNKLSQDIRKKTKVGNATYPIIAVQALVELLNKKQREINQSDPLMFEVIRNLDTIIDELNGFILVWKMPLAPQTDKKTYGLQYPFLDIIDGLNKKYANTTDPIKSGLEAIDLCLSVPRKYIADLLSDWEKWGEKDYSGMRLKLPLIFARDPDLSRLYNADIALLKVEEWRNNLLVAPQKTDYPKLISIGKDIEVALGECEWLKEIIEALELLSGGSSARDVVFKNPTVSTYLPWLKEMDPPAPVPVPVPVPAPTPPPAPLPDPEAHALELFYDNLKLGNLHQAIICIQRGTSSSFSTPYIKAVKQIEAILGLSPAQGGKLISIGPLSPNDSESINLLELIKRLHAWMPKQQKLGNSLASIQDSPQVLREWPIVKSIIELSKSFSEKNSAFAQSLKNILETNDSIDPRNHGMDLRKSLADINSNLEHERENWNGWINNVDRILGDGSSLAAAIINLLKESQDTQDYIKSLDESKKKFASLAHRLDAFQTLGVYTPEQWKNAETFLIEVIKLNCPAIPSISVRENWQIQFSQIRYGSPTSRETALKNLNENHPLHHWLKNAQFTTSSDKPTDRFATKSEYKPVHSESNWMWNLSIIGIMLLSCIVLFIAWVEITDVDIRCWLNPSCITQEPTKPPKKQPSPTKENPTVIPTITVPPTQNDQPENLHTPSAPIIFPIITVLPSQTRQPENFNTHPNSIPDPLGSVQPAECQTYLQYFDSHQWDLYFDDIAHLTSEQYQKLEDACLWSYTQAQKENDIKFYQAMDNISSSNLDAARNTVESIIKKPLKNTNPSELFFLIQKARIINSMCNLPTMKLADAKTINRFIKYSNWLVRSNGIDEQVFFEICQENYNAFQARIISATLDQSQIISLDYLSSALLAIADLPNDCSFIPQQRSIVFAIEPEFINCLQYGQLSENAKLLDDQGKNRIFSLTTNFCFSPNLFPREEHFGIVVSQNGIPGGQAFVLSFSQPLQAHLYAYNDYRELAVTDVLLDGTPIQLDEANLKLCQPVSIQLNKVGNIIFWGNEQGIPQILPIVIPDEYRMFPLEFGLITPTVNGMEIQIDKINLGLGDLP